MRSCAVRAKGAGGESSQTARVCARISQRWNCSPRASPSRQFGCSLAERGKKGEFGGVVEIVVALLSVVCIRDWVSLDCCEVWNGKGGWKSVVSDGRVLTVIFENHISAIFWGWFSSRCLNKLPNKENFLYLNNFSWDELTWKWKKSLEHFDQQMSKWITTIKIYTPKNDLTNGPARLRLQRKFPQAILS